MTLRDKAFVTGIGATVCIHDSPKTEFELQLATAPVRLYTDGYE